MKLFLRRRADTVDEWARGANNRIQIFWISESYFLISKSFTLPSEHSGATEVQSQFHCYCVINRDPFHEDLH